MSFFWCSFSWRWTHSWLTDASLDKIWTTWIICLLCSWRQTWRVWEGHTHCCYVAVRRRHLLSWRRRLQIRLSWWGSRCPERRSEARLQMSLNFRVRAHGCWIWLVSWILELSSFHVWGMNTNEPKSSLAGFAWISSYLLQFLLRFHKDLSFYKSVWLLILNVELIEYKKREVWQATYLRGGDGS